MPETSNIAEIAALVSDRLFSEFLWKASPVRDENFPCEQSVIHNGRNTHPADVVMSYDEPYRPIRTYLNTDLKSYASGSITPLQLKKSIFNLAQTLQCAELSQNWQEKYVLQETPYAVAGMLFMYNHDGAYDRNFNAVLRTLDLSDVTVPRGSRIYVVGPQDIHWLNNVRYEINQMRGSGLIPVSRDSAYFYHPHLARHKNVQVKEAKAATIEMLLGPWITMRYRRPSGKDDVVVFLRERGESPDEFLPLLDYLMNYQLIKEGLNVQIKTLAPHENAAANFMRAVDKYIQDCDAHSDTSDLLHNVRYSQIADVHMSFSALEAGLRDV